MFFVMWSNSNYIFTLLMISASLLSLSFFYGFSTLNPPHYCKIFPTAQIYSPWIFPVPNYSLPPTPTPPFVLYRLKRRLSMHICIICLLLFSLQGRSKNGYLNYPCVIFSNQTLQFQNGKIPKYIEFFEYLFLLVQIIQSFTSPPHFYLSLVWICNFNVVFFKLMNLSLFSILQTNANFFSFDLTADGLLQTNN